MLYSLDIHLYIYTFAFFFGMIDIFCNMNENFFPDIHANTFTFQSGVKQTFFKYKCPYDNIVMNLYRYIVYNQIVYDYHENKPDSI